MIRKTGLEVRLSDGTTILLEYKEKSNDVTLTIDEDTECNLVLADIETLKELLEIAAKEIGMDKMENLL